MVTAVLGKPEQSENGLLGVIEQIHVPVYCLIFPGQRRGSLLAVRRLYSGLVIISKVLLDNPFFLAETFEVILCCCLENDSFMLASPS